MLTKNQIKLITQLKSKKYRVQHQLFVVEGVKSVLEFINTRQFELDSLYTTDSSVFDVNQEKLVLVDDKTLKKVSNLKTPNTCLAVFKINEDKLDQNANGLRLALDDISDPGNLGTIIRLCDWFGVETLYCSLQTVDCYNPKVVQATMGSLNRVNVIYTDLHELLAKEKTIYGAFMDGENVYESTLANDAVLLIGNEANGISNALEELVSNRISIPKFGKTQEAESLNAAIATGILLSEFSRRSL